jgi:hypothetical protein
VSERFSVQVDADQFDHLARPTQPLAGVAELVWNSLDAEADVVTVVIGRTELDAVDEVIVIDDGHGMTYGDAIQDFKLLGGSWKKTGTGGRKLSKQGKRTLHGSRGEGRFRAFALGQTVEWMTVAKGFSGRLEQTLISGSMETAEFVISDPKALATGAPGTTVRASIPRDYVSRLLAPNAATWLITRFAIYLVKYPSVAVIYDGIELDPSSILEHQEDIQLDSSLRGRYDTPVLRIMEWSKEIDSIKPSLVLCDENGVALEEIEGVETKSGIRFTAYVMWAGFAEFANELLMADLDHVVISPVVRAAREAIESYLTGRAGELHVAILDQWKTQRVYPYEGEPTSLVEAQERQVFDTIAVFAAPAVAKEPKAAKLSLRLIRSALAESPGALHRVLREVLDLTAEQLMDFDRLLERTTLASIIHTSKIVTDRLEFLDDLQSVLFDDDKKGLLLERRELHPMLANGRTWVFGEDYNLAVSDKGLTKVLKAHLELLGINAPGIDAPAIEPVTDVSGKTQIVDLMLSKAILNSKHRQHLVVELKRPSVILSQKELGQIFNYAIAVTKDPQFKTPEVNWEFWLVGDELDETATAASNQKGRPTGLYQEGENYRIWVRRWAELIEENRQRLHFFREHLDYVSGEDIDMESTLAKYLPQEETSSTDKA